MSIRMSTAMSTARFTGTYPRVFVDALLKTRGRVVSSAPDACACSSFAFSFRGSAANAYACRFCTSSRSTGVVNSHSSWRRPEKETRPLRARGVAAPWYTTYQSFSSHISLCVHAETALMYATCRFSLYLEPCELHAAALMLNASAVAKMSVAQSAWNVSTCSSEPAGRRPGCRRAPRSGRARRTSRGACRSVPRTNRRTLRGSSDACADRKRRQTLFRSFVRRSSRRCASRRRCARRERSEADRGERLFFDAGLHYPPERRRRTHRASSPGSPTAGSRC